MGYSAPPAGGLAGNPSVSPERLRFGDVFRVLVDRRDATLFMRLTGEFDAACVDHVEGVLQRNLTATVTQVVFDLRGLSFLDLAGLKTILKANERARTQRFDLAVVRPSGLAGRIFTLTRAGEQLTMVDRPPPTDATSARLCGGRGRR